MDSSTCAASEGLEKVTPKKDQLPLDQDCVEKMSPVKEHVLNEEQSFCAPTEGVKEVCKHVVVTSAISSMDKCAECVGPVAALKWIGLRDEINMTDSDDSDPEESDSDDDALAGAAGDYNNAGVQKMPTEVPEGTRGLNCNTTINVST